MKKYFKILLFLLFLLPISCTQEARLHRLEQRAEKELVDLESAILSGNLDSIWLVTRKSDNIHYLIFREGKPVFWSDNSLTSPLVVIPSYDHWYDYDFSNAMCRCRWSQIGEYKVETIIPFEWHVQAKESIEQSFSYQPLLELEQSQIKGSHRQVRLYLLLTLLLFALLMGWTVLVLVRAHGFRNLKLSRKIQLIMIAVLLLGYASVIVVSANYIRRHNLEQQQVNLQQKSLFVQAALKNLYFWDYTTSTISPNGLNVDLRDLAYAYGTDIHVYDINGLLLGSSTPQLFQYSLLSRYLEPEVMFTDKSTTTCFSSIGDVKYLSAYTEFVNGNNIQLGYIALPSFISLNEVRAEVDTFLARLLPVYILVLLIAIMVSLALSRVITEEFMSRYNGMKEELARSSEQLARSEREGAWRTMARQIAHEINNPLTPMRLTLQQLQRLKGTERFDEQFDRASGMLIEQVDNLSRIASSFSSFAKQPTIEPSVVDVAQKLSSVVMLCANNPQGVSIRYFGPEEGVMARADKEQIGQAFNNILRNAVQAVGGLVFDGKLEYNEPKGDIIVILKNDPKSPEIEISISDNGPGIPPEIQQKIFLPNFTTKSNGAGLGLAITKHIVEGGDGRITFTTSAKGTTFYIYLKRD